MSRGENVNGGPCRLDWHGFDAMPPRLLYDIMALRQQVFVVEQACIYLDLDGRDADAEHLAATAADGALLGCLRLFKPGTAGVAARLGRIVVAPAARGRGVGAALIREGLAAARHRWPGCAVAISAQAHLQGYYGGFGFVACGDVYDEDGIPHIAMTAV